MRYPSPKISRRLALGFGVALVVAQGSRALAQGDADAPYDALLRRYVKPSPDGVTRVDYAGWRAHAADRAALDAYIAEMAQRRPSTMVRGEALAYWGNLYNAVTLKVVIDRYPVASIRDIKSDSWLDPKAYTGPWRQPRVTVLPSGGLRVSSIYKWFIEDFGGDDAGLLAHFLAFAEPELKQKLARSPRIVEDDYDWSLNRSLPIS